MAAQALWPTTTTTTRDHKDGSYCPNVPINGLLGRTVWPTPRVTANGGHGHPDRAANHRARLEDCVQSETILKAVWPTCKSSDDRIGMADRFKGPMSENGRRSNLNDAAAMQNSVGSSAPTEKRGSLNPEFVCWLMGYPSEWLSCAPSEMPSTSARRPRSSKPSTKA